MKPLMSGALAAVRSLQHETVGDQRPFTINRKKLLWEAMTRSPSHRPRNTENRTEKPDELINLQDLSVRLAISISTTEKMQTGFFRRRSYACKITMREDEKIPIIEYVPTDNACCERLTIATAIVLASTGEVRRELCLPGGIERPDTMSPLTWSQTLSMATYLLIPMRPLTRLISENKPWREIAKAFGISEHTLKIRLSAGRPPRL